jgi:hypothetical protein
MVHNTRQIERRVGFTLVELMVAMALILFIMLILSEAFVKGLQSFHQLKGIGDMEEKLRAPASMLRRDLGADHFEGRRRVSDPNYKILGPPREGYFRIVQNSPSIWEGKDTDQVDSYRATTHSLWFTAKLRGNRHDQFFKAWVPDPSLLGKTTFFNQAADARFQETGTPNYQSPWAEIGYFLVANGTYAGTNTPLYTLYRSQFAVVPDSRDVNYKTRIPVGDPKLFADMDAYPDKTNNWFFYNPSDLAAGNRIYKNVGVTPVDRGTAVMLSDVISFDIRVLKFDPVYGSIGLDFVDLGDREVMGDGKPASYPYAYDSAPSEVIPLTQPPSPPVYCVSAIMITIRVWDLKTEQTRQITVIQDM